MEVSRVLHMNGGAGEASYAANSQLQKNAICMTTPTVVEAITKLCGSTFPEQMAIADLGCSSGPNTFLAVSEIIRALVEIYEKRDSPPPEVQVYLNDLPGNDFNTVFRSLPDAQESLTRRGGRGSAAHCFFAGAPGSFYGRLFPSATLHFVYSSYSLHWLSKVPDGLEGNKGNIFMSSTSPPAVLKAYYKQFQMDFSEFLKCRAVELVAGGYMVLTLLGRKSENPSSKECCYSWDLLAMVLNDMVSEGLLEGEKVEAFHLPQYTPSPSELKYVVEAEGSFAVDRVETSEVNWNPYDDNSRARGANIDEGYNAARSVRAVAEPLLVSHFGEGGVIDEVFRRFSEILVDRMAKERTQLVNVTVSLKRG